MTSIGRDSDQEKCSSVSSDGINRFNFLLTNARSLTPKVDSFIENFQERDIDLCVVTETWLHEEQGIFMDDGVALDVGLSLIHI